MSKQNRATARRRYIRMRSEGASQMEARTAAGLGRTSAWRLDRELGLTNLEPPPEGSEPANDPEAPADPERPTFLGEHVREAVRDGVLPDDVADAFDDVGPSGTRVGDEILPALSSVRSDREAPRAGYGTRECGESCDHPEHRVESYSPLTRSFHRGLYPPDTAVGPDRDLLHMTGQAKDDVFRFTARRRPRARRR